MQNLNYQINNDDDDNNGIKSSLVKLILAQINFCLYSINIIT